MAAVTDKNQDDAPDDNENHFAGSMRVREFIEISQEFQILSDSAHIFSFAFSK